MNSQKKTIAMILFLFSGLISLVFQVAWLKMLLNVFGSTVWAAGTLLTTFMAGLAIGSWLFGRIADRTPSPLRLYGIIEGIIGLYGILTLVVFSKLPYVYIPLYRLCGGDNVLMGLCKFILALVILLPPTICMGATLPLLARQFTRDTESAGSGIGALYTVNTLGAVLGTLVSGFFLLPMWGLHKTVLTAAVVNFFILAAILLVTRGETARFPGKGLFDLAKKEIGGHWIMRLYFICGFAGLAYEVTWNRVLTLHLGSSVYAYSIMLAVYLLGVTLGSGIMSFYVKRIKNPIRVFALMQILLAFDLIIIINQFGWFPRTLETMGDMAAGHGYFPYIISLSISVLQLLILPTVLFGACFPLAVRLFVNREQDLGKETGSLYAANTLGAILGSFAAGFLLLPLVGAQLGMLMIASLNLLVGIFLVFKDSGPKPKKLVAVALVALLFYGGYFLFTAKNQVILTAGVFQDQDKARVKLLAFEEDIYATVTIEERNNVRGAWRQLSMNGVNVAGTSSELFSIQKLQGHLPLLLHNNPKSVLHIGFGSGGTAWSVSRYPVEKITIAEISPSVIKKASKYFQSVNHDVLKDPRVEVVFTDGRNKVLADPETYDVILSDSIHPRFSGNGSLYTYDYYQLLKKRLKPGGLVSQWLPFYSITPENFKMIVKSFYEVFPNTSIWFPNSTVNSYVIVIGKLDNGLIDYAGLEKKLAIPEVKADLKEIDSETPYKILDFFLFANEKVGEFVGDAPLHTDDNMAVEYLSGRALSKRITSYLNYISLLQWRTPVEGYLVNLGSSSESKEMIVNVLGRYWIATTYNLDGQRLFWEGRRSEAFAKFDLIPIYNPEDKEPVEYFGSSYQAPFLKKATVEVD
ncbi:MAG: spermidine synthase [Acidobacteriota bacterium]|nr:spermidine synthase [Acidobacteriota bacterium]